MIRKIVFFLLFAAGTSVAGVAFPQAGTNVQEVRMDASYEGEYAGVMDVAMSKGKTVKGREATFVLKDGTLCCDLPKLGKMPGKIKIELPVKVDADGTFSAVPESEAGVMKMPMGFKFKLRLEELKDARVDGRVISFTLTVYGQMMGTKYPTTIGFRGVSE